jgi:peptide/nickel transport system ATP-binding protein
MGMIFVTHDMGVAAQIADKVAVMYAGRIVECGNVADVLMHPSHPYTLAMLSSTVHGQPRGRDIEAIRGSPPDLRRPIVGCSFAPRCKFAITSCTQSLPEPIAVNGDKYACCTRIGHLTEMPEIAIA